MSNNQIIELQSMISTADSNNEIVEKLKDYITKKSNEKRVNWQMLACYLDGKIFEFIQANKGNEIVDKFATELVEELGDQFNLTRQL
jgi:hypothetical protein|tara:strand:- start:131 stop:391 length:261 start_codon:yes stop_codon:yes gene_type:complete